MITNRTILFGMLISIVSVLSGYYGMMFVAIFIAFLTLVHIINIDYSLRGKEK